MPTRRTFLAAPLLAILAAAARADETPFTGPWKLDELRKPPNVTWGDEKGLVRTLYYESEPRDGRPTRVFAYCGVPAKAEGRVPAMVLVHGGGGKAFAEWARLWAERGYVGLAMDLAGHGPDGKRLPDGGPDQGDATKFPPARTELTDMWSYHAVAAVVRGVSLLRSLPEVDAERIGVTGISWGGYLTCIVAGLDDRLKVAAPVYGCGYLHENSVWLPTFEKLPADWRKTWVENFDPSRYLKGAKMPVLFVNGTNDFAYPLDSYQKSYRLAKERQLCVTVNMPHGHSQGWAPVEIGLFADQYLRKGTPLPAFTGEVSVVGRGQKTFAQAGYQSPGPLDKAELHWTTDTGAWQKRKWHSAAAPSSEKHVSAELPAERPLVYFLTITDKRKATVSTENQELK
jgi:dienelactone hydrolase